MNEVKILMKAVSNEHKVELPLISSTVDEVHVESIFDSRSTADRTVDEAKLTVTF